MLQEISKEVWHHNYQAPNENSVEETWRRQAVTAASIEKEEVKKSVEPLVEIFPVETSLLAVVSPLEELFTTKESINVDLLVVNRCS